MTPEQELQRAREAQRLMDDPLFKAAKEDLYGQLRSARQAAKPTATEMHSKLILMEQLADRFFGYFEQLAQTGLFAQRFIAEEEERAKGLRERLASYVSWGRNGL